MTVVWKAIPWPAGSWMESSKSMARPLPVHQQFNEQCRKAPPPHHRPRFRQVDTQVDRQMQADAGRQMDLNQPACYTPPPPPPPLLTCRQRQLAGLACTDLHCSRWRDQCAIPQLAVLSREIKPKPLRRRLVADDTHCGNGLDTTDLYTSHFGAAILRRLHVALYHCMRRKEEQPLSQSASQPVSQSASQPVSQSG
jgi:hypothetical protein